MWGGFLDWNSSRMLMCTVHILLYGDGIKKSFNQNSVKLAFLGGLSWLTFAKRKKTYQMRTIFGGINHYNDVIRQTTVYHCTMTVFFWRNCFFSWHTSSVAVLKNIPTSLFFLVPANPDPHCQLCLVLSGIMYSHQSALNVESHKYVTLIQIFKHVPRTVFFSLKETETDKRKDTHIGI